jgi:hypothetical protein
MIKSLLAGQVLAGPVHGIWATAIAKQLCIFAGLTGLPRFSTPVAAKAAHKIGILPTACAWLSRCAVRIAIIDDRQQLSF